jgi:uncharacterized membrane protein
MMAKKKVSKKTSRKKKDSNLNAFVATFLSIIGFFIALLIWKDDKYVMYYAKQSLVIFIGWVIVGLAGWIPIIGWAYSILVFVLWIVSWVFALQGEKKRIWIVSDIADKINV